MVNYIVDETWYKDEKGKVHHFIIKPDDDPWSPREGTDCNIGHMMCWYKGYNLGDKNEWSDPYKFLYDLMRRNSNRDDDVIESMKIPEMLSYLERKGYHFIPLAVYEHSGITMWCGSRWSHFDAEWDCSDVGWIYTTRNEVLATQGNIKGKRNWIKVTKKNWREAAQLWLEGEVEIYDQYLTGQVYGYEDYEIDEDGDENLVDSCWGCYTKAGYLAKEMLKEYVGEEGITQEEADKIVKEYWDEVKTMEQCEYLYAA